MLCYATLAPFAVLAPKRPAYHTLDTEILIVKLPKTHKLIDDGLLIISTSCLGDITRILDHCNGIEVCAQGVADEKQKIEHKAGRERIYQI